MKIENRKSKIENPRTAFTLIELLVVIAIVGLLAGLLFPTIHKAREYARSAKCMSNLRQLHQAVLNYGATHGGRIPRAASREHEHKVWVGDPYTGTNVTEWSKTTGWLDWLQDPPGYKASNAGGNKRTYWWGDNGLACITNGTLFKFTREDHRIYLCPTFARSQVSGRNDAVRNYVMNSQVSGGSITMGKASRTLLFADGGLHAYPVEGSSANPHAYFGLRGRDPNNWDNYFNEDAGGAGGEYYRHMDGKLLGYRHGSTSYAAESIGDYHNGLGNAIFMDGHTEKLWPSNTIAVCEGDWGDY